jgi:prepilin-type N-terminal cleavage/methylation domain-containing protein
VRRRRAGFTVLELIVALVVSGVALVGARMVWETLTDSADRLRMAAAAVDRTANGERLLRTLFARLEIGTDSAREFAGSERVVRFTTWCDVPAGWEERCRAEVAVDTAGGEPALVARLSTGERVILRRGFRTAALRYLNDPAGGGQWFRLWGRGIVAPYAVGVLADSDTTIVRIGERG